MWEAQRLRNLWASMTSYRDIFTFQSFEFDPSCAKNALPRGNITMSLFSNLVALKIKPGGLRRLH
jgi:hypothetical protein